MNAPQSTGQMLVDQGPKYENGKRGKKPRRENQVIGKTGIIRPDKRKSAKFI